jgi:hypothetical protein
MTIGWLRWLETVSSSNGKNIVAYVCAFLDKITVIYICHLEFEKTTRFANVTDGSVIGVRAPYLRIGGNKQFEMMADQVSTENI